MYHSHTFQLINIDQAEEAGYELESFYGVTLEIPGGLLQVKFKLHYKAFKLLVS